MINLKKLFRRKKGQGALEYLFMIAAALIIIFVVVRYISQSGSQASQQGDIAALQSQAELAKSNLQARGLWKDDATLANGGDTVIKVTFTDGPTYNVDVGGTTYESEAASLDPTTYGTLGTLYDKCIQENDETACKILISLGEAKWEQGGQEEEQQPEAG